MASQSSLRMEGVLRGARQTVPPALGDALVGVVFGIAARRAGLDLSGAVLMSSLVAAGTSQFVALGIWASPLPVLSIVVTTMLVNLRHLLMSAAISPRWERLPARIAYPTAFFLSDESFVLAMRDLTSGGGGPSFVLGSGLLLLTTWIGGTLIGALAGGLIQVPSHLGLDYVAVGVMAGVLVGLWKGRADIMPWVVAASVAILSARLLPGNWYILLGGLTGSLAAMTREPRDPKTRFSPVGVSCDEA